MPNQNGQLLLKALEIIKEPSSATTIVSYIAGTTELDPKLVRSTIIETLKQGVRFGYIQEKNKKYFVQPVLMLSDSEIDINNNGEEYSDPDTHNNGNAQPATSEEESDLDINNNFEEAFDEAGDYGDEILDRSRRKRMRTSRGRSTSRRRSASPRGRRR